MNVRLVRLVSGLRRLLFRRHGSLFDPRDARLSRLTLEHYRSRKDRDKTGDFATTVTTQRSWKQTTALILALLCGIGACGGEAHVGPVSGATALASNRNVITNPRAIREPISLTAIGGVTRACVASFDLDRARALGFTVGEPCADNESSCATFGSLQFLPFDANGRQIATSLVLYRAEDPSIINVDGDGVVRFIRCPADLSPFPIIIHASVRDSK